MEDLRATAAALNQAHIFEDWDSLSSAEQQALLEDVGELDLQYVSSVFKASTAAASAVDEAAQPVREVQSLAGTTDEQRQQWRQLGYELIASGRAAVLLLAGGQGTRLGSSAPKGCYDVGLPSRKSLFQLQAERLRRVQQLAAQAAASAAPRPLHWYIMTSRFTHEETLAHFEAHDYFGLRRSQVTFFQQGVLPCLSEHGDVIMESGCKISKAPDGNGGLYRALHSSGALRHMAAAGVECLDCYCVDNILARVADPEYLGFCYSRSAEVGCKVVAKAYPEERVGVFATKAGGLHVLEYSELDPARASALDPATGQLYYNWSNICMHYFSTAFLIKVHAHLEGGSAYHVARKRIPSKAGPVQGIKLELFIFDPFQLAAATALYEIAREEHFSPVKNAPGSATDSPDSARRDVLRLHKRWVEAAGGKVAGAAAEGGLEVSPLVSYAGEGLLGRCSGAVFQEQYPPALQQEE